MHRNHLGAYGRSLKTRKIVAEKRQLNSKYVQWKTKAVAVAADAQRRRLAHVIVDGDGA